MRVLLSGLNNDRVELNLVRALHGAGMDLTAIVSPDSPAEALCASLGIFHHVHEFRHRLDIGAMALYRRVRRDRSPQIFHCLSSRALSTALLAMHGAVPRPRIVAYRGTCGHLHGWDPASRLSHLHPGVDVIVCVSDAVRRYLQELGLPASRLEVIWKGHDPAWYSSAPRDELSAVGIPSDSVCVGFVGNMRPVKGVGHLLRAFDAISSAERIHLALFGEVRDRSLRRQTGQRPHVHFAGYRPDAARLAGACDIAVMPSIEREGLPKAILEAMAQGIPPVVTDVGGMPELVENGVSGIVVPPRDAAALAEAIRLLARDADLRHRMGAAARERIQGPFHFRHTADKTLALYQRLSEKP